MRISDVSCADVVVALLSRCCCCCCCWIEFKFALFRAAAVVVVVLTSDELDDELDTIELGAAAFSVASNELLDAIVEVENIVSDFFEAGATGTEVADIVLFVAAASGLV